MHVFMDARRVIRASSTTRYITYSICNRSQYVTSSGKFYLTYSRLHKGLPIPYVRVRFWLNETHMRLLYK